MTTTITFSAKQAIIALALALAGAFAWAGQYQSETRELNEVPAEAQASSSVDLEAQLKTINDPYARAMIYRELAYQASNSKNYAEAKRYAEAALKAGGLSPVAAAQLKKELDGLSLPTPPKPKQAPVTAMQVLEAQVKAGTASPEGKVAVAANLLQKKRYAEAIPLLQSGIATAKQPDDSWKQALLAAYLATGQDAAAIPLLRESLRKRPQLRDNWLRLAAIQLKTGDKAAAAATLELAARQGHLKNADERMQLVVLTTQLGAPFEAASQMQRWMGEGALPRSPQNWSTLGGLWARAREAALAVKALEEAETLSPSSQLLLQIGQLQLDREQYALAATALQKAAETGAANGATYLSLGLAYYQSANIDDARTAFTKAQNYSPSRKLAADWLKYLQNDAARSMAVSAAKQRKPPPELSVMLSSRLGKAPLSIAGAAAPSSLQQSLASMVVAVPTAAASAPASAAAATLPGGGGLTPVGAELSGSADGRIPPWTGGLMQAPAGYAPGQRLKDPYPQEAPLFTITAANVGNYAKNLAPGHLALFKRYPDYAMPVYASHRSAAFPQAIYDASKANDGKAHLEGSDGLVDARLGFPFIKPKNGVEVMWNHRTRYRGDTVNGVYTQAVVTPSGSPIYNVQTFKTAFRYGSIKDPVDIASKNILVYGITHVARKGSTPDFVALFHETANSIKNPRNIWVLITKLGRLLRIPPVGYDQPFPGSEGLEFIDMVDMYNGAFDRYVWKLTGKRELYIPYNAYRMGDGSINYAKLLTPNHANASRARYELHRVWAIEATERGGQTHRFGKRTFYIDEDSWNIVLVENEDHDGQLWRFQEGHLTQDYAIGTTWAMPTFSYDLKDSRYFANRLFAEDLPFAYNQPMKDSIFLPANVQINYSR